MRKVCGGRERAWMNFIDEFGGFRVDWEREASHAFHSTLFPSFQDCANSTCLWWGFPGSGYCGFDSNGGLLPVNLAAQQAESVPPDAPPPPPVVLKNRFPAA